MERMSILYSVTQDIELHSLEFPYSPDMKDSRRIIKLIIENILAHSYNDFDFCVEKEVG